MSLENIINSGKRILSRTLLVGTLAVSPLLSSYGKDEDAMTGETQALGISEELQEQWPIWKSTDLESNKHKGPILAYNRKFNIRPKFYDGSIPLQYKGTKTLGAGPMTGTSKVLRYKFEDFSNYFIYRDFFDLVGAVSVDNNNKMVAEAKIDLYMKKEGKIYTPNAEVEEFHYDGGLLIFHCKSQFEKGWGMKQKEIEYSGKKQKDYFFILPIGISE